MKTVSVIMKVIVALAAIAGILYVAATYGDKIVAWCRKVLRRKKNRDFEYDFDYVYEDEDESLDTDLENSDFES